MGQLQIAATLSTQRAAASHRQTEGGRGEAASEIKPPRRGHQDPGEGARAVGRRQAQRALQGERAADGGRPAETRPPRGDQGEEAAGAQVSTEALVCFLGGFPFAVVCSIGFCAC